MRVLVAEDDIASGKFLSKLLSRYGEVVLATDGIAAVDEFVKSVSEGKEFDLVCLAVVLYNAVSQNLLGNFDLTGLRDLYAVITPYFHT